MRFIILFISLCCAYIAHAVDRTATLSHLERYITATNTEDKFSNELKELKDKITNVEELRNAGQTSEADELDKTIEQEFATLRKNIAQHSTTNKGDFNSKNHFDDARARMERAFAKTGKERVDSLNKNEVLTESNSEVETEAKELPGKRTPEESKQLRDDMMVKQKEFLEHRKQELISRISKAGYSEEEQSHLLTLVDEYVSLENEVMESRNKLFNEELLTIDSTQRVQYHRDMKVRRDKEKKASDAARLKRKEIDDALRKKIFASKEAHSAARHKKEEL